MPTQSFSGGAARSKKSLSHRHIFSFISFYPRSSAFIPVEQPLAPPRCRLLELIQIQIHISRSPHPYLPIHPEKVSTGMNADERG